MILGEKERHADCGVALLSSTLSGRTAMTNLLTAGITDLQAHIQTVYKEWCLQVHPEYDEARMGRYGLERSAF